MLRDILANLVYVNFDLISHHASRNSPTYSPQAEDEEIEPIEASKSTSSALHILVSINDSDIQTTSITNQSNG